MVLIFLISLTSCKTTEYIYPDITEPEIKEQPTKQYIDGGFRPVDGGQFISTTDARVLAEYIRSLKGWGSLGWYWITDYYMILLDNEVEE